MKLLNGIEIQLVHAMAYLYPMSLYIYDTTHSSVREWVVIQAYIRKYISQDCMNRAVPADSQNAGKEEGRVA
jgi:hypothetical protein